MPAGEIAAIVLGILMKAFKPIYDFVQSEIDGGTSAQELRDRPWKFSVSFGGGEGDAVKIQREVEGEMANPLQD